MVEHVEEGLGIEGWIGSIAPFLEGGRLLVVIVERDYFTPSSQLMPLMK
jgi:hypothetical protein